MSEITKTVLLPVSFGEKFFSTVSSSVKNLRCSYEATHSQLELINTELDERKSELDEERDKKQDLIGRLKSSVDQQQKLKTEYHKVALAFKKKQQEIELLKDKMEHCQTTIADLNSRYDLVCSAVSPVRYESPRYRKFKELLDNSLLPFINRVSVVANEAQQMMKIRSVDDELRLADSLAAFSERTIVAVAGGFSSGKSSLITSLFTEKEVSLPIGIEPVTAIPTYVFHADDTVIRGYPEGGGYFDVPKDIYARLSHKFVEEFGFNFRDLLPFMSLEVPMNDLRNIAFIDLPGYNPGDRGGFTRGDQVASDEFVAQGQALLWVIGLDSNGSIPGDDLDKLWELSDFGLPLYIVLNKADLRPQSTLNEVLDQITDELEMNSISYEGICAYSSSSGTELAYRERSLMEVLQEWDSPRNVLSAVVEQLNQVLSEYEKALEEDVTNRKNKASLVKGLELNLLEIGAFETDTVSSGFDVERYMNDSSDSDQINLEPHIGGVLTHIFKRAVFAEGSLENTNAEKNDTKTVDEEEQAVDSRHEQVEVIRNQLQSLRQDYSSKQSEQDLQELSRIRQELNLLLS